MDIGRLRWVRHQRSLTIMNLYATIYVGGSGPDARLVEAVRAILGGSVSGRNVSGALVEVSVMHNKLAAARRSEDDFLGYPYRLEVEPVDGAASAEVIVEVGRLVDALRKSGWPAVPSCDYEDLLPKP